MPSKRSLPIRVRSMPIHVQRKYSNGEFDKTGSYGHSAMAKHLYGITYQPQPYQPQPPPSPPLPY